MRKEPKLKKRKGRYVCIVCGELLNDVTIQHQDPFCKTDCARSFHGVALRQPVKGVSVAGTQ